MELLADKSDIEKYFGVAEPCCGMGQPYTRCFMSTTPMLVHNLLYIACRLNHPDLVNFVFAEPRVSRVLRDMSSRKRIKYIDAEVNSRNIDLSIYVHTEITGFPESYDSDMFFFIAVLTLNVLLLEWALASGVVPDKDVNSIKVDYDSAYDVSYTPLRALFSPRSLALQNQRRGWIYDTVTYLLEIGANPVSPDYRYSTHGRRAGGYVLLRAI